jgi:hypothetical protein
MKSRIRYKLLLFVFVFGWVNSFLCVALSSAARQIAPSLILYDDFDGDNQPEAVTAVFADNSCQITTQIKQHQQTISIPLHNVSAGDLSIISRDIDSDLDKDILIINKRTQKILSVLINDGKGRFTRSDTNFNNTISQEINEGQENSASNHRLQKISPVKVSFDANSVMWLQTVTRAYLQIHDFFIKSILCCLSEKPFCNPLTRSPPCFICKNVTNLY